MTEVNKTPRIILQVITIPLTIFIFYIAFCFMTFNKAYDKPTFFNKYSVRQVISGSMEPEIMTGEYILFDHVKFNEIEVGDNIAYESKYLKNEDGTPAVIIHKAIEKQKIDGMVSFVMKGVNNDFTDDEVVTMDNFISKEIYHSFINPTTIFAVLGLIDLLLLFGIDALKSKEKELRD